MLEVVGIGGATKPGSSTDRLLATAMDRARAQGARTHTFGGDFLKQLPLFDPERPERTARQAELLEAVRGADAILLASPAYHGTVSALFKNAIDLLEDLRTDARPYLDGRSIGCLVTGYGAQGCGSTLATLRTIAHALRGWPTPLGVALNTAGNPFGSRGELLDPAASQQVDTLVGQLMSFAANARVTIGA